MKLAPKPKCIINRKICLVLRPIYSGRTPSNGTSKRIHLPYCPPDSTFLFIETPPICFGITNWDALVDVFGIDEMDIEFIGDSDAGP